MYLITWITTHLATHEGWMAELAMKLSNLQSDQRHQNTNSRVFAGQLPLCRPTSSVRALNAKCLPSKCALKLAGY